MYELQFEQPFLEIEQKIQALQQTDTELTKTSFHLEIRQLKQKKEQCMRQVYSNLSPWQIVQIARHPARPTFLDYVKYCVSDFIELHGDRKFADDPSLVCGLGSINKMKVALIGHQKGKDLKDNIQRNFGMANPEGYRKALRVMKLAEKFNRPIITFIDTPGAYPGIEAEERGQSQAIADNLFQMSQIKVPIITVIIGEGGSGGALAIALSDKTLMLSNSIYSVISPEGCASILWRDSMKAPDASSSLKLTAKDLIALNMIDEIIQEPIGGAHRFHETVAALVKDAMIRQLDLLQSFSKKRLLTQRFDKWTRLGNQYVLKA